MQRTPKALLQIPFYILPRTARLANECVARSLTPLGIAWDHAAVMLTVAEGGEWNQQQLADLIGTNPNRMVRIIDSFAKPWVRRFFERIPDTSRAREIRRLARRMARASYGSAAALAIFEFELPAPRSREPLAGKQAKGKSWMAAKRERHSGPHWDEFRAVGIAGQHGLREQQLVRAILEFAVTHQHVFNTIEVSPSNEQQRPAIHFSGRLWKRRLRREFFTSRTPRGGGIHIPAHLQPPLRTWAKRAKLSKDELCARIVDEVTRRPDLLGQVLNQNTETGAEASN